MVKFLAPLLSKKVPFLANIRCCPHFLDKPLPNFTLYLFKSNIQPCIYQKCCSKSNMVTMDHKHFPENSSSAALNTLPNTIIYLNALKYLNIRLRHLLTGP